MFKFSIYYDVWYIRLTIILQFIIKILLKIISLFIQMARLLVLQWAYYSVKSFASTRRKVASLMIKILAHRMLNELKAVGLVRVLSESFILVQAASAKAEKALLSPVEKEKGLKGWKKNFPKRSTKFFRGQFLSYKWPFGLSTWFFEPVESLVV